MPGVFFLFKKAGKRSDAASTRENFLFRQFAPQAGEERKEAKIRQGSAFGIRFWERFLGTSTKATKKALQ